MILHLAPHKLSGHNVCASASPGCIAACLNTSGHGRYNRVQDARIKRTKLWFSDRAEFQRLIMKDIQALIRKCDRENVKPAVRMNGTSDILWEKVWPELFTMFPQVQFYDYTKHEKRCRVGYTLPANYHLTFSRSEVNDDSVARILAEKRINVAVVFKSLPKKFMGVKVYNGDEDDLRFLNRFGVIGLTPKGRGKHDKTGFVV
jgi:hypothetical protein